MFCNANDANYNYNNKNNYILNLKFILSLNAAGGKRSRPAGRGTAFKTGNRIPQGRKDTKDTFVYT